MGRLKRFGQELGKTFKSFSDSAGKVLNSPIIQKISESDRIMNEKIKKATGGIE